MFVSPLLEWLADRLALEKGVITRNWEPTPYLTRWVPRGGRTLDVRSVYLHRFERSDAAEMHDHPWPFTSGVPADPDSPHKVEGCRVGGRPDVLPAERDELRAALPAVGERRQFPAPCYCRTASGHYCVGRPQCRQANAALQKGA